MKKKRKNKPKSKSAAQKRAQMRAKKPFKMPSKTYYFGSYKCIELNSISVYAATPLP